MTIEQLKNFLVVATTLNFRKSTEQIYIAQPALSRQIQQLEIEIGTQLFDRSKKQIQLTAAGRYFQKETHRIIHQLEQAKRQTAQIGKGEAGELTIGHASSAMQSVLPALLRNIQTKLPGLKIGLEEGTNRLIFDKITNRELDFGLVPNATTSSHLASWVVYRENFVLIAPADYALAPDTFTSITDFANSNWILPPRNEGHGYVELLQRIFQNHGFTPKVVYESPNSSSVLRLIDAGLGLTIIGKSSLNGLNLRVKYVELTEIAEKVEMRLVWLKERENELAAYIRLFQSLLQDLQNSPA